MESTGDQAVGLKCSSNSSLSKWATEETWVKLRWSLSLFFSGRMVLPLNNDEAHAGSKKVTQCKQGRTILIYQWESENLGWLGKGRGSAASRKDCVCCMLYFQRTSSSGSHILAEKDNLDARTYHYSKSVLLQLSRQAAPRDRQKPPTAKSASAWSGMPRPQEVYPRKSITSSFQLRREKEEGARSQQNQRLTVTPVHVRVNIGTCNPPPTLP